MATTQEFTAPSPYLDLPGAFPESREPTPSQEKSYGEGWFPNKSNPQPRTASNLKTETHVTDSAGYLQPDAVNEDGASTASIASGVIGEQPRSRAVSNVKPDAVDVDASGVPTQPETGHTNNTYTAVSYPLHGAHRVDQSDMNPDTVHGADRAMEQSDTPQTRHFALAGAAAGAGAAAVAEANHEKTRHTASAAKGSASETSTAKADDLEDPAKSRGVRHPETGPASFTKGPHRSNLANIFDPRVKPNIGTNKHEKIEKNTSVGKDVSRSGEVESRDVKHPETGPASFTKGPHKSNLANILDPRVKPDFGRHKKNDTAQPGSDPSEVKQPNEHDYGRDATVVGGAGLVGVGAAKAWKSHQENSEEDVDGKEALMSEERMPRSNDTTVGYPPQPPERSPKRPKSSPFAYQRPLQVAAQEKNFQTEQQANSQDSFPGSDNQDSLPSNENITGTTAIGAAAAVHNQNQPVAGAEGKDEYTSRDMYHAGSPVARKSGGYDHEDHQQTEQSPTGSASDGGKDR
jgi:hypothetical protein